MAIESDPVRENHYSWQLFSRPLETWEAMYRDCVKSVKSIEFEQYILENDSVGERFMELFIEKAKAGINVFLVCDTFGSALLTHSPLVETLREHGGRVFFYNKIRKLHLFTPWRWFPRTHIKTLLVDSSIAYTGGVCMAERMREWRDTHIRLTGPVVQQIRHAFDDIENRMTRKGIKHHSKENADQRFSYFLTHPQRARFAIYRELKRAVKEAQSYIYITSAFFIPNRRFIRLLKHAKKRGVDVRILVPEQSDVMLADWICLSYMPKFMRAGFRIFHYRNTVMHSKTAIIDDHWGTVGSTNFDVISFFHNREANIVTTDKDIIAALKRQFFIDLENCVEMTTAIWAGIPLWKKIVGRSARLIKVFFG